MASEQVDRSEPGEPIRIVLTPEQRELIRRASGQHAEMLELTQESDTEGRGGTLRFRWRLSAATGIPRQKWVRDDGTEEEI